jgi:hypothetical protein
MNLYYQNARPDIAVSINLAPPCNDIFQISGEDAKSIRRLLSGFIINNGDVCSELLLFLRLVGVLGVLWLNNGLGNRLAALGSALLLGRGCGGGFMLGAGTILCGCVVVNKSLEAALHSIVVRGGALLDAGKSGQLIKIDLIMLVVNDHKAELKGLKVSTLASP